MQISNHWPGRANGKIKRVFYFYFIFNLKVMACPATIPSGGVFIRHPPLLINIEASSITCAL
jgi:hypothetical protein